MKSTSLLIFGLDGATWKIIHPWIKQGKLPFLRQLIKKGVRGTLKSPIPPLTSTSWVSFQTGVSPEKHGVFGFLKSNGKIFTSQDISQPSFWQIASRFEKKSAIINLPLTFPPQPFPGILVTSFLTPPNNPFTHPPRLQKELLKLGYQTNLKFEHWFFQKEGRISPEEKKRLLKKILHLIKIRKKAALHILKKQPWDIFFLFFKSTDTIQHFFWRGKETLRVYQEIDRSINQLTNQFRRLYPQKEVNLIILSDHGFHPAPKKEISLYPLFSSLKILPSYPSFYLKLLRGLRKITKTKLWEKLVFPHQPLITDFGLILPKSRKKEAETIRKKLIKAKVNQRKVFQEIRLTQSRLPHFPDLIWITNPYFVPNADPLSGEITYPAPSYFKARHHSDREGIFIAAGPRVKKRSRKISLEMIDLPVNILNLLAISPPSFMEGKPRPDIFSFPRKKKSSPKPPSPLPKRKTSLSPQEEKIIIKRLKALGYVD